MYVNTTRIYDCSRCFTGDFIFYSVEYREAEDGNIQRLSSQLDELKKAGSAAKGKLLLSFSGYDFDPREIYEIPEIRSFMSKLLAVYPYFFYFLSAENAQKILYFCCLTKIISVSHSRGSANSTPQVNIDWEQVNEIDRHTQQYAETVGDSAPPVPLEYLLKENM